MSTVVDPPVVTKAVAGPSRPTRSVRGWWWAMLVSSLVGIASGMTTVMEKIALLKDPGAAAFCDFNDQIGCTPVLLAPQSSVLGPPNAAIGVVMFAMFVAAALAGVMGTWFPRSYRYVLLGLSVFFGLFLTWYMQQVAFAIGSLCPFCAVCAGCVMVVVLAATRLSAVDVEPGDRGFGGVLGTVVRSGLDVIVVIGWTLLIAGMLVVGIML
jgi:uncharacterized membrane protein